MIRITTAAVLALAGTALAQPAITIDVENPILMPGQSTTVTLFAGFEFPDFAMGHIETGVLASVGSTGFSDHRLVAPMDGGSSRPGAPSDTGYDDIYAVQWHFPPAPIYADSTNPILFWEVTYTAPMEASASFDIVLSTTTSRYDVYIDNQSPASESRLADLSEGAATIRVIPAPASASLLAMGLLMLRRRR